jgi:hypothetical protein
VVVPARWVGTNILSCLRVEDSIEKAGDLDWSTVEKLGKILGDASFFEKIFQALVSGE